MPPSIVQTIGIVTVLLKSACTIDQKISFKVFRYSFSETIIIPIKFSPVIEVCQNAVLSKIDVTMTTTNKKL